VIAKPALRQALFKDPVKPLEPVNEDEDVAREV
jgi:hypothetical protein